MKIHAINNQNQHKSNFNFNGKLIFSENLSERALELIKGNRERLLVLAEKSPSDMFVRELPTKEKNIRIAIIPIENTEEPIESAIAPIIEEINNQTNFHERIKEVTENFLDNMKYIEKAPNDKRKNRYYIPKKIGKPQKPFIKKNKH